MRWCCGRTRACRKSRSTAAEEVLLGSPDLMAGLPGNGPLTVSAIVAWLDDSANHAPLEIKIKKDTQLSRKCIRMASLLRTNQKGHEQSLPR